MTATAPITRTVLRDGRYELGDLLGRGGVAVTHRALDHRLGRWVAVKSLVPDPDPEAAAAARSRFLREARTLARFDHPGIVRVYEAFEEGGTAHLVTEYLHGRSLAAALLDRGRPLDLDEALSLAGGVGRALRAVHAAGLLHRDVSPSNVMLVAAEGGPRPVLIDFGLARFVDDATSLLTRMVTPGFAPIEQYGGDPSRSGPPTDVYGLAATLYHALSGRLPVAALDRQAGVPLPLLRRLRPDLPRYVADAVHDGLELDAAHRPETVERFLHRLGLDVGDVGDAGGPPTVTRTRVAPTDEPDRWVAAGTGATGRPESRPEGRPGRGAPASPTPPGANGAAALPLPAGPDHVPPPSPASPPWSPHAGALPPIGDRRRLLASGPPALLAAAAGAAAPVVALPALVLVVLPVLATVGDRLRGRRRLALPWRLVRNVARSLLAALPALGLAAVGIGASALLDNVSLQAGEVTAGVTGAVAAVLAVWAVGADRYRFAVADTVDRWQARARPDGRLARPGVVAWVVALAAVTAVLALRPDLWPLGG